MYLVSQQLNYRQAEPVVLHQLLVFVGHLLHFESRATYIVELAPNQTRGLAHPTKLEVLPHLLCPACSAKAN
jgi:hypothetical protein